MAKKIFDNGQHTVQIIRKDGSVEERIIKYDLRDEYTTRGSLEELPLDREYSWNIENEDGSSERVTYTPEDGDVIFETVAIRPDYVNANNDFWSYEELVETCHTFIGKPLCLQHNYLGSDPGEKAAIGIILDAYFSPMYDGVVCVCAIGSDHPFAQEKVLNLDIDSVSMGCSFDKSLCSIDGIDENEQNCGHRKDRSSGAYFITIGSDFYELSLIYGDHKSGYNQAEERALFLRVLDLTGDDFEENLSDVYEIKRLKEIY